MWVLGTHTHTHKQTHALGYIHRHTDTEAPLNEPTCMDDNVHIYFRPHLCVMYSFPLFVPMRGWSLSSRVHLLPNVQEGSGSSSGESWKRLQNEDSSSVRPVRRLLSSLLSATGVLGRECCEE